MNPDDMQQVIDTIPQLAIRKWDDRDIQMLFKILYWCGLRPIEGIKLEKADFNFVNREINLHKTKTRKNDHALIPSIFCTELELYVKSRPDGRLFHELTYDTFYRWLKRLGVLCNIEAWTTHQKETGEKTVGHIFRKSIGKDMIYGVQTDNNGNKFDIVLISKHLRHAKPSTTIDHYLKANIQQIKEIF